MGRITRIFGAAMLVATPLALFGALAASGTAQAAGEDYAGGWPTMAAGEGGPHINVTVRHDGEWTWHDRSNPEAIAINTDYQMRIRVENFTYATLWAPDLTTVGDPTGGQNLRCDYSPFGGPVGVTSWPEGSIPHGGVVYCLATAPGRATAGTIDSDYKMTGEIRPEGAASYTKWGADWWWGKVEAHPAIDITKWSTVDGPTAGAFDVAPGKRITSGSSTAITMTIVNSGNEVLMDPVVTDTTLAGTAMTGLSCDFSALGGPSTGTISQISMNPGDSFTCTGTLPALADGEQHSNSAMISIWANSKLANITDTDTWNGIGTSDVVPAPEPSEPTPAVVTPVIEPTPDVVVPNASTEPSASAVPAASQSPNVTAPSAPDSAQLAQTGSESGKLVTVAISLTALGSLLVGATIVRRKKRA